MQITQILTIFLSILCLGGCSDNRNPASGGPQEKPKRIMTKITRSDAEWRQILTPEQYRVLREKGTEPAFAGAYWDNHEKGVYRCAACGAPLFRSQDKFDSGTGWPSFTMPIDTQAVATEEDDRVCMRRTEVLCAACGGHLGHVFDDGPAPTGLRYCMNSAAMKFENTK